MNSVNAGSINLHLGVETEAYVAGMKRVSDDVDSLGKTYDGFTARGARSFLMLSGSMADLTKMSSMSAVDVAGSLDMMSFHVGHMAEQMKASAGSAALSMAALGKVMQTASLIAGAFMIGWQIGMWISDITGLTAAAAGAKKPFDELADTIGKDAERYEELRLQTITLSDGLGLLTPAAAKNTTATREGAAAMLEWCDNAIKAHKGAGELTAGSDALAKQLKTLQDNLKDLNAQGTAAGVAQQVQIDGLNKDIAARKASNDGLVRAAEFVAKWKDSTFAALPVQEQMRQSILAMTQHETDLGAAVMKTYGILTETQAAAAVGDMEEKIRQVALAGGDAGQVLEKMGPDITKAVDAATKMGANVPFVMQDMAEAIKTGNASWLGDLMSGLKKTPEAAKEGADESAGYLDAMGNRLKGSISGGFGEGIKEGTNAGKQRFDEFVATVTQTPIRLSFDIPDLHQAVLDAVRGVLPNTGGNNR